MDMSLRHLVDAKNMPGDIIELKSILRGIVGNTFALGISGSNIFPFITKIQSIQRQVNRMEDLTDILSIWREVCILIESMSEDPTQRESSLSIYREIKKEYIYSTSLLQEFCIHRTRELDSKLDVIIAKVLNFPQLQERWGKKIEEIGGNLEVLMDTFTHFIDDPHIHWEDVRRSMIENIVELEKIEDFVDKYIRLKTPSRVDTILGQSEKKEETPPKQSSQQKEDASPKVSQKADEMREKRRKRVLDYVFKKDRGDGLFLDSGDILERMRKIEELYLTFGVSSKELEEILGEKKHLHDRVWLRENIRIIEKNPSDDTQRKEIECALYFQRKHGTQIDLTGMHGRTDQKVEIFTQEGSMTLFPPFVERGELLYGKVEQGGKYVNCKFDPRTLIFGKSCSIEIIDMKSSTWQAKKIIPLILEKSLIQEKKEEIIESSSFSDTHSPLYEGKSRDIPHSPDPKKNFQDILSSELLTSILSSRPEGYDSHTAPIALSDDATDTLPKRWTKRLHRFWNRLFPNK